MNRSTFKCICSSTGSLYFETSIGPSNSNTALSCNVPSLSSCKYFAIIAKKQDQPQDKPNDSVTELSNNEVVLTGIIRSAKYYKIQIGPYETLRLSSFRVYSGSGDAIIRINLNNKPSTFNYYSISRIAADSVGEYTSMSYSNTNSWTEIVYISVEQAGLAFSTALTFTVAIELYEFGSYTNVLAIFGGTLSLFALGVAIIVMAVVLRRSRPRA